MRRTRYAQVDAIADVTLVSRGRDHLGRRLVGVLQRGESRCVTDSRNSSFSGTLLVFENAVMPVG